MIDAICQIGILATGLPAIWLLNQQKRIGSLIGLIGQIFWITTTLRNHQWGMFILTLFYTASWTIGTIGYFRERSRR